MKEYKYQTSLHQPIRLLGEHTSEFLIVSDKPIGTLLTIGGHITLVLIGYEKVRRFRWVPFLKKRIPVLKMVNGKVEG